MAPEMSLLPEILLAPERFLAPGVFQASEIFLVQIEVLALEIFQHRQMLLDLAHIIDLEMVMVLYTVQTIN